MQKLYSPKTLLKMAGKGMHLQHPPSESTPNYGHYYQLNKRAFSSKARENKLFLFDDSAT